MSKSRLVIEMLHKNNRHGPPPYELYEYKQKFSEVKIEPLDDYDYKNYKRTHMRESNKLLRRQNTLNIVGFCQYKTDSVNFDYVRPDISYIEKSKLLPKEIHQEIAQFFGFLVYTYVLKNPRNITICHYPNRFSAYHEFSIRYEWTYQHYYDGVGDGYTLQFLTYNPNQCITQGIDGAISAKNISQQKYFINHNRKKLYSGSGLEDYRELCLVGNTKEMVLLQSLRIDPVNPYGIKNFGDLIDHIKQNKMGKATGTSGSSIFIDQMNIDWDKMEAILPTYADKLEIPGDVLYTLCADKLETTEKIQLTRK